MFDFQLQFYVDEAATPIEDASVDWPESIAPYVNVARLGIPQQEFAGARSFDAEVEAAIFDPWSALMAPAFGRLLSRFHCARILSGMGQTIQPAASEE